MEKILLMNLTITLVVPCILLTRKLFLYHVSGRTWLFLWKILIFGLLCPFAFEIPLKNTIISKNASEFLQLQSQIQQSCRNIVPSSSGNLLKIIWLVCGLLIAGIFIGSHWLNTRTYKMALPVDGEFFEQWKRAHCLRRKIEIRKSDRIRIPLTYGIIKPVILLPTHKKMPEERLEAILEHEFIHIKCFDILLKWILVLLCSLYWYNPLIWVMYLFANRDMELSCDEAVLKHHSSEYRKSYLLTLLDLEERNTKPKFFCSSFCKYPTEERIKVMIKRKKSTTKSIFFALLIFSMVIILNMGISAGAGGNIPGITGLNEEQAQQALQKYGFSFITEKR